MAKRSKGIKPWMIVLAGVAAVGVIALNVSRKIYVKSMRVKIPRLDFSKVTLRLMIEMVNQSGVGVPIDGITGILKYGNDPISGVNLPTSVVIKSKSTTTMELDLVIPYQNLSEQVLKMFKTGTWYRGLYFEGHVLSKGILIPVKQNIQIL